jgi:ribosomal protein S12
MLLGIIILVILVIALASGGGNRTGGIPTPVYSGSTTPANTVPVPGDGVNTPLGSGVTSSGGDATFPPPISDIPPVIPATTKVLTIDTLQYLTYTSPDLSMLTFSTSTPELSALQVGDVIVADVSPKTPYGFLRKVSSVNPTNGQVTIQSSPSDLAEAIQDGSLHAQQQLTYQDIAQMDGVPGVSYKLASVTQQSLEIVVQIDDVIIYDNDGDLQTELDQVKLNGELIFEPSYDFQLLIQKSKLQELYFSLEVEKTSTLEFVTSLELLNLDKKKELARFSFKPMTFWISFVPVVIVPELTVEVGVEGDVQVGIRGELQRVETYTAGITYDTGQWATFNQYTRQYSFDPPTLSLMARAEFEAFIGPQLNLMLYGIVGPYISTNLYAEINADPFVTPWWKFYSGVLIRGGVKLEILDKKIADVDMDIVKFRVLLAWAQDSQNTPTPTFITTTSPPISVTTTPFQTPITTTPFPISTGLPVFGQGPTILVFDTSGSMQSDDPSGMSKIEAAKAAGGNLLDIFEAGNLAATGALVSVGVVQFNSTAAVMMAPSNDFDQARSVIERLYPTGRTAMAAGLKSGIELLTGQPSGGIILLSDGLPNIPLDGTTANSEDEIRQQVLDLAQQAGSLNICVYTIGFGEAYAGTMDETFLIEVANQSSCGAYYPAVDAMNLANVYTLLGHQTSGGSILFQQTGEISQNQQLDIGTVNVPDYQENLHFTLNWPGSRLDPVLLDPQGQTVDANYPGASLSTTQSLASIIVQNPVPGPWKMVALGAEVPEGIINYNAILSVRAGAVPQPTVAPTAAAPTPPPPAPSGLAVALIVIALVGGGLFVFVKSQTVSRDRARAIQAQAGAMGGQTASAQLILLDSQAAGSILQLHDKAVIGRSRTSTLQIADAAVSRQHALFRYSNGQWFIQDLGSAGGTFVNGAQVSAQKLNDGDHIQVGASKFVFKV